MVGTRLTEMLLEKGYQVGNLSRSKREGGKVKTFVWDPIEGQIDDEAIAWADGVVHLAGANVGYKRWTDAYKKEIMDSRTYSTRLLVKKIKGVGENVKAFVSASAIGIYGDTGTDMTGEDGAQGPDFLAEVCRQWEAAADGAGIRTVKLRVGVVLSDKGGAVEKIAQPIKLYAGAALGTGKQYVPWIHLDDVCRMFIYALENESLSGVYNATTPNPVTNAELTRQMAKALGKPLLLPPVPKFVVDIIVGEMSVSVLRSSRISSAKVEETGFKFEYPHIEGAIQNLLG